MTLPSTRQPLSLLDLIRSNWLRPCFTESQPRGSFFSGHLVRSLNHGPQGITHLPRVLPIKAEDAPEAIFQSAIYCFVHADSSPQRRRTVVYLLHKMTIQSGYSPVRGHRQDAI